VDLKTSILQPSLVAGRLRAVFLDAPALPALAHGAMDGPGGSGKMSDPANRLDHTPEKQ
jgi:hypothetical protein